MPSFTDMKPNEIPPVKAYQCLVVISALLGITLWLTPYLPISRAPEIEGLLSANGADALFYEASFQIKTYLPAAYIVAAIGLFFFTWWGRWLFSACYALGIAVTAIGGFIVSPAFESVGFLLVTLVDGAILGLAFLSPLSEHFDHVPV
jgi:hypothetical protein